ncbi:MAG: hypothetical protein KF904_20720 [Rhodoblastus sp.]|nr:hypothetical protein [Rhodoblastus sp.]
MSFTRAQVAKALGVTRTTIDNMIQRGHFGTDRRPAPTAKYGWTTKDAVRLATAMELSAFIGGSMASMLADHANYDSPPGLYLVATPHDWPHLRGVWSGETVTRDQLAKDIAEGKIVRAAAIINLDSVVNRVVEGLLKTFEANGQANGSEEN